MLTFEFIGDDIGNDDIGDDIGNDDIGDDIGNDGFIINFSFAFSFGRN